MSQLPITITKPFWGANPSFEHDNNGTLFYSYYANGSQHVFKLVSGVLKELTLEHVCTARGNIKVSQHDGKCYLIGWDDQAAGLWFMLVPEFAPIVKTPPSGGTLEPRYVDVLNRLCALLGIK